MSQRGQLFQYTLITLKADFPPFTESFREFCQTQKVDQEKTFDMEVSLEELIVNSFSYGNKNGPVRVHAEITQDELKVTVEDQSPPFDLLRDAPAPPKGELLDRPEGGLGIHLVKNLNDRVEYTGSHKGNKITLFNSIK